MGQGDLVATPTTGATSVNRPAQIAAGSLPVERVVTRTPDAADQVTLIQEHLQHEAEQAAGQVALHKVGETSTGIVVRGARILATLAMISPVLPSRVML